MILRTPVEVANVRRNIGRYDWSRSELDDVLKRCEPWLDRTDAELWSMVTGQAIPRGIHVNENLGCPECGREVYKFGNYPWIISLDRPWKLECPSCGEIWPRNDFAAFHESGLGPGGVFHRELADKSLLTGPDGDYCIDDSLGWVDGEGNRWWFIAYYSHYGTWRWLPGAALDLATAWIYTGVRQYAHKAALILDRIADVYPDMDLTPYSEMNLYNSHGGTGRGRIQGCIWETFVAEYLARAWDMVSETVNSDGELVGFLSEKASEWKLSNAKSSPELIAENVNNGLLKEFIASCRDRRISGNEGMTQTTMAVAAAVLDDPVESPAAIEWLFEPGSRSSGGGGHIPQVLIGEVDRDGVGNEASPGYSFIWMNLFSRCADVLERCTKHHQHDLYAEFPRLRRMYSAPYRLTALDTFTPNVGDTGSTGRPGMVSVDQQFILDAFTRFHDPWFAQVAYRLNGGSIEGLHTSVFDDDPEAVRDSVGAAIEEYGELEPGSANLNGYGLTVFRSGTGAGERAAWFYYGRSTGHGHRDRLNFGMYFRGMDVIPDLGYPEYADGKWAKRAGWTRNTISHNTVVVDARGQTENWIGHCKLFAAANRIGVVEVDSPEVYPGIDEYRRTLAFIDVDDDNSYLVDVFRVVGGSEHVMSFHSGEGAVETSDIEWNPQAKGTYAGEDIEFGVHYDGPPDGKYAAGGYSYLTGVERASRPEGSWYADWSLVDTWSVRSDEEPLHLRYHAMASVDEAAMAWGEPPRNKPGNPERLRYLLLKNNRSRSLFAGVIELYCGDQSILGDVERLDLGLPDDSVAAAAIRVHATNGSIDSILSSNSAETLYDLGEGIRVAARFALVRQETDGRWRVFMVGGTRIETPAGLLTVLWPQYTGRIRDFHRDDIGQAWIDIEGDFPQGGLLGGSQLRVCNDGVRDACYSILSVSAPDDGMARFLLEDTSFVRGLNENGSYIYNIETGDACDVQTVVDITIEDGKAVESGSSAEWRYVIAKERH